MSEEENAIHSVFHNLSENLKKIIAEQRAHHHEEEEQNDEFFLHFVWASGGPAPPQTAYHKRDPKKSPKKRPRKLSRKKKWEKAKFQP
jgi:hypothetical protein